MLNLVTEAIDTQRLSGARRKNINQPTAQRIFARLAHCFAAVIAVGDEEALQILHINRVAGFGAENGIF